MKTLIVSLIFISQSSLANNGQGTMGGSQSGNLIVSSGSVGTMIVSGNGQGTMLVGSPDGGNGFGTMKVAGNSAGTMGGSQVGSLIVSGYLAGTGGGGILAMHSNGADNSSVGNFMKSQITFVVAKI